MDVALGRRPRVLSAMRPARVSVSPTFASQDDMCIHIRDLLSHRLGKRASAHHTILRVRVATSCHMSSDSPDVSSFYMVHKQWRHAASFV